MQIYSNNLFKMQDILFAKGFKKYICLESLFGDLSLLSNIPDKSYFYGWYVDEERNFVVSMLDVFNTLEIVKIKLTNHELQMSDEEFEEYLIKKRSKKIINLIQ